MQEKGILFICFCCSIIFLLSHLCVSQTEIETVCAIGTNSLTSFFLEPCLGESPSHNRDASLNAETLVQRQKERERERMCSGYP